MAKKRKRDDPEQSKQFVKKARELGSNESGELFERAFNKIAPTKRPKKHTSRSRQNGKQFSP